MMKYTISLWNGLHDPTGKPQMNPAQTIEAKDRKEALIIASMNAANPFFIFPEELDEQDREKMEIAEKSGKAVYLDRSEYGARSGYLVMENAILRRAGK